MILLNHDYTTLLPAVNQRWITLLDKRKHLKSSFRDRQKDILESYDTNRLLTEREGRTGEYWPEVVAVRTGRSEVRTATTEGQYPPVRPEQARLASCLLYGILFLIIKCTSDAINLFSFLSF